MSKFFIFVRFLMVCIALGILPVSAQSDDNGIVFVSTRGGYRDIYWMNANGEDIVQLTNDPAQDLHPSWSPDGSQIAFVSDRDGSYAVYVMNADGSEKRKVTGGDGGYYEKTRFDYTLFAIDLIGYRS